jgi:hypothetical protein
MNDHTQALLDRLYDGLPCTAPDLDQIDADDPLTPGMYAVLEEPLPWHATELKELDTLPPGSVVVDATETAWQLRGRTWCPSDPDLSVTDVPAIAYPAVAAWIPKEERQ